MWVSGSAWHAIIEGALSEALGSLLAAGGVAAGSWLLRCVRRWGQGRAAAADAATSRHPGLGSQIDN